VDGALAHLFVGSGNFCIEGVDVASGDSVRAAGTVEVDGDGALLVVRMPRPKTASG
jgi:hypothetical protein